ncbi:hypothetical protein EYF80_022697 [Liparis tanakae]|uniref:Uncharacterized protein n=1 Tax=Liparis tanakae TaxID=230148 RepID=A0A4Z2HNC9_9TELE|nr:hypothetical protein EYF80_022697 [Liparis tanakae]
MNGRRYLPRLQRSPLFQERRDSVKPKEVLLLMPASRLRQDGPPAGNSCGALPKDQLTSTNAAKIRWPSSTFLFLKPDQDSAAGLMRTLLVDS